jgi:hypothetical protein
MASVDVDIDLSPMVKAFGDANIKKAVGLVAQTIGDDSNEYVPVATGALQASMNVDVDKGEVSWGKEYADIVYNADHVISAGNPLGTPHWVEVAEKAHLKDWSELAIRTLVGG